MRANRKGDKSISSLVVTIVQRTGYITHTREAIILLAHLNLVDDLRSRVCTVQFSHLQVPINLIVEEFGTYRVLNDDNSLETVTFCC